MTLSQDILAELAEIAPGSPLDQARAVRDAATRHAQGSYEVLFRQQDADFPLDERFAVAAKVAKLHRGGRACGALCRFRPRRSDHRSSGPGAGLCPPAHLHPR